MTDKQKIQISTSAKIYADSLIQAGKDSNINYNDILNELNEIKEITEQSEDFVKTMISPSISDGTKYEILDNIFSNKINEKIINFLKVLVAKRRFNELNKIIQAFSDEVDKINNVKRVEVISAADITDDRKQRIVEKLQHKLEKNVIVNWTQDKDIIGGLVIKIDDDVIDNSLKNKLEKLSKNII